MGNNCDIISIVNEAEEAMQQDKRRFYENNGNGRQLRSLNKELEQMIMEKQDADTFLEVLAPDFKGVYFVNLGKDTIRHLYIPPYFEDCLQEANNQFSKAMLIYARKIVNPKYFPDFEKLCDYEDLKNKMNNSQMPELIYQKINGDWLKLQILKFRNYTSEQQETLWIFANINDPTRM